MARVSVANRAKLSWLLLRSGCGSLADGSSAIRWCLGRCAAQGRTALDRAAGSAYRRRHPRQRNLFRTLRLRRQGRGLRRPLDFRDDAAVGRLGGGIVGVRLAAPSARRQSGIARANARALVDEWIALQGAWHPIAWRPDVLSRRVISWLSQAPLLLQDADVRFYRRFLRSLVRQIRYLRHTAGESHRGVASVQAAIALCFASLCIAGQARHIKAATARLKSESSGRSCPMAAISAAIPARSSRC